MNRKLILMMAVGIMGSSPISYANQMGPLDDVSTSDRCPNGTGIDESTGDVICLSGDSSEGDVESDPGYGSSRTPRPTYRASKKAPKGEYIRDDLEQQFEAGYDYMAHPGNGDLQGGKQHQHGMKIKYKGLKRFGDGGFINWGGHLGIMSRSTRPKIRRPQHQLGGLSPGESTTPQEQPTVEDTPNCYEQENPDGSIQCGENPDGSSEGTDNDYTDPYQAQAQAVLTTDADSRYCFGRTASFDCEKVPAITYGFNFGGGKVYNDLAGFYIGGRFEGDGAKVGGGFSAGALVETEVGSGHFVTGYAGPTVQLNRVDRRYGILWSPKYGDPASVELGGQFGGSFEDSREIVKLSLDASLRRAVTNAVAPEGPGLAEEAGRIEEYLGLDGKNEKRRDIATISKGFEGNVLGRIQVSPVPSGSFYFYVEGGAEISNRTVIFKEEVESTGAQNTAVGPRAGVGIGGRF